MSYRRLAYRTLLLPLLFLVACSQSSTPPVVTVTSHSDGEVVTGDRAITVSGTIANSAGVTGLTVTLNGVDIADVDYDDTSFSVDLTLANNENAIELRATSGAGDSNPVSLRLDYPFMAFADFQPASVVIGQANFEDSREELDASHVGGVYSDALVHDDVLYLPVYGQNRILVFNEVPTENGAAADWVLGQEDFTSDVAGVSASSFDGSQSPGIHDGKFFLSDYNNHRVLLWNTVPTEGTAEADVVVGQTSFEESDSHCSQQGLYYAETVIAVDGRLLVADTNNHRVLIWNEIPSSSGAPADLVLGQMDFEPCDSAGGMDNASTLYFPSGLWSDGERLIVADSGNNRVLIWNSFPSENGAPADVVVGQPDMETTVPGEDADSFDYPYFLDSNGNQLIVADTANHRVMIWDQIPSSNGVPADRVLGQSDFTHNIPNDDDQDGSTDGQASARTMANPRGIELFDDGMIVTDGGNNRFLIFEAP